MIKKIITVFFIVLIFASSASAGWLDQWFDQQVSSGPNYFEGQKRGYFTAGSFSARIPSSTDYLFSIEAPRIKAGCGGIDAFLGGFGFTNFDYLVQKFQRLIQAAPVVAFQIALNTLSSQLEGIIGKTEDIINALNSIQLNECAMMKPFTTIDLSKGNPEKQFVDAAQAAIETTGLTSLYKSLTKKKDSVEDSTGRKIPPSAQYEGCSAELRQLVTSGKNSLIDYLASQGGYSDIAPIMRAMIGDIIIIESGSFPYADLKPACSENVFQALKEGKLYKKDSPNGQCVPESAQSLNIKVVNVLTTAYTRSKTKNSSVDNYSDYQNLVKLSPLPVHLLVRYAVATGDTSILSTSADPVAKGLLYQAYTDVFTNVSKLVDKLKDAASKTNNPSEDGLCNVDVSLMYEADNLRNRMYQGFQVLSEIYAKSLGESQKSLEMASLYKRFEDIVFGEVASKVGKTVAERALR
ncbi:MAG: conjugal transfer protein TraH [Candidatus Micrarchaeia archaeon]